MLCITNGLVWLDGVFRAGVSVTRENGRIRAVGAPVQGAEILDAQGGYIVPGFVDIHTHGAAGHDFSEATPVAANAATGYHLRHGTTTLVATLPTMPLEQIEQCLRFYRDFQSEGAAIAGIHLEGPFLSEGNRGAHNGALLLPPDQRYYAPLLSYADVLRSITVAPELANMPEMISALRAAGITVSGGHTMADEREIEPAVQAGMTHTTHLFCAMSSWKRDAGRKYLGLTEFALLDDRLTVELLADGFHVSAPLLRLAYKCKGAGRACLASDSLSPTGMPRDDTLYYLGRPGEAWSTAMVVDDGVARLPDRSLNAGSVSTLDSMLRFAVRQGGLPLEDAVRMVTETPARIVGLDTKKGRLAAGWDADVVVLDRSLKVRHVIAGTRHLTIKGESTL